jgi:hypothetical protein
MVALSCMGVQRWDDLSWVVHWVTVHGTRTDTVGYAASSSDVAQQGRSIRGGVIVVETARDLAC